MALFRQPIRFTSHISLSGAFGTLLIAALALAPAGPGRHSALAQEGPPPCIPISADDTTCDRVDDDCDGVADDDVAPVPTSCGPTGACPSGIGEIICLDGNLVNTCDSSLGPQVLVQLESAMRHTSNVTGEAEVPLVEFGSDMLYIANTSAPVGISGMEWTATDFDDSLWTEGSYGVGYELTLPGADPLIQTDVSAGTYSVFTRRRFTLSDVSLVRVLFVSADYDDGYVVWINGVEVFRSAEMPAGALAWNTNAALHESSNSATPNYGSAIDITHLVAGGVLRNGPNENVLAVGVWNNSAPTSTDLVLVPRLAIGTAEDVKIRAASRMRYLANSSAPLGFSGIEWTAREFDDSSWVSNAPYGVGYETALPGASRLIATAVPAGTFSVFTRVSFSIGDPAGVRRLTLGADYDDGFVAWINGVEVARSVEMPPGNPEWNTNASLHESSNGSAPNYGALLDITAVARAALRSGDNVLAIGVWNSGAPASTDLVLVPRLSVDLDWTDPNFVDLAWLNGSYGVGYETALPGATNLLRSRVQRGAASVYTRARFMIDDVRTVNRLMLGADWDDGFVAWLNGVEVFGSPQVPQGALAFNSVPALHESSNGDLPNYSPFIDISARGIPLLRDGVNVLAVAVWNRDPQISTDLVIVPRLSIREGEICDGIDNDCDGSIDEGFTNTDGDSLADCVDPNDDNDAEFDVNDCRPGDPLATAAPPAEASRLNWTRNEVRQTVLSWSNLGAGMRYDLIGGMAQDLHTTGTAGAACMYDDLGVTALDEIAPTPAPGQARYYLVRAQKDGCGSGTYGFGSNGAERLNSACP